MGCNAEEPVHVRVWRGLHRFCSCGLRWPCLDRRDWPTAHRVPHTPPSAAGRKRLGHVPSRPTWGCRQCGLPWPCAAAKAALTDEYRSDRLALLVYLAACHEEARADLNTSGLYERFIS